MLNAEAETGISLTDSLAMAPAASVSGLYFAHPQSEYFAVGKVTEEQLQDYASRKHVALSEMEKWLNSNLAYDV